ncbi:MAG: tetratricopeptide repeat-containing glycosyltransferase family protein [Azonexus sp.]
MLTRWLDKLSFGGVRKRRLASLMLEAVALHQRGELDSAESLYQIILGEDPRNAAALSKQGLIHLQRGDTQGGLKLIASSLRIDGAQIEALSNQGKGFFSLGKYREALASYDSALSLDPGLADTYLARAGVLANLGRFEEALGSYDRALGREPKFRERFDFLYRRGETLHCLKRHAAALADFERAAALSPERADVQNNSGSLLKLLGRYSEALVRFDRAIALAPDFAAAHFNRGVVLQDLRRYEEAVLSYDQAILAKGDYADAYANKGCVLRELGAYDAALECHRQALAINPQHVEARFNSALLLLLLGDFSAGWALYESRWETTALRASSRGFQQPLWDGRLSLSGKTILLHAEQGFGDTVQFCRYLGMVRALAGQVIIEVQASLVGLLAPLAGTAIIKARGEPLPAFDIHCPLMSLPLVFATTLTSIPDLVPYLVVDPFALGVWQERLGTPVRRRIGLVWAGSREHANDHKRSVPLVRLLPLLELDAEFHCLQKIILPEDKAVLAKQGVFYHEEELDDFSDTAALVSLMDLVISVDTVAAHVAGALGKPVWILLPFSPDFRWLTERADTPWYPSARLFRQGRLGDWDGVVSQVLEAQSVGDGVE